MKKYYLLLTILSTSCTIITSALGDVCGDDFVQEGETCDDGGVEPGDGCDPLCQDEAVCGNGRLDDSEECDDGNQVDEDNCKNNCEFPIIVKLSAGGTHTCITDEFSRAKCWGRAEFGQLGYGNVNDIGGTETPASVGFLNFGPTNAVSNIATGDVHSCALVGTNSFCWGNKDNGRLGYNNDIENVGDNELPNAFGAIELAFDPKQIDTGDEHTCAILRNNSIVCWGLALSGQLSYGDTEDIGDDESPLVGPVDMGAQTNQAVQVSLGSNHTCAIVATGAVRCWGINGSGQLGYPGSGVTVGDQPNEATHTTNVGLPGPTTQISAGNNHTCALLDNGDLVCWGLNASGQLGLGGTDNVGDNGIPVADGLVLVEPVSQVSAGGAHTCAVLTNGTAKCWGANANGQLGTGDTANFGGLPGEVPATLTPINVGGNVITHISAGFNHTCALFDNGKIRCWGNGEDGRLGYGNTNNVLNPANVNEVSVF